jgi:plasmid stabilization system protein ParE
MSRYRVVWTRVAQDDLDSIIDFIAQDSPTNALGVAKVTESRADALCSLPLRGRVVPELSRQGVIVYRELLAAPWRIIYRTEGDQVVVLGVFDGRRQLEDLLIERFMRY